MWWLIGCGSAGVRPTGGWPRPPIWGRVTRCPVSRGAAVGGHRGRPARGAGRRWPCAVIRRFFEELPCSVDAATRERAEADLAKLATQYRPEQVAQWADLIAYYLNPDGTYTDEERARRRGLTLGNQGVDGMSLVRGWLTPEARATVEAVLADGCPGTV